MWKQHAEKINYWSLCLLACFPVVGMKATVILIIAFSAISVITALIQEKSWSGIRRFRELWLLLIPFLLIFCRTFIFDRSEPALFYLEVSLSLLAFPLAFYFSPIRFTSKQRQTIQWIFTLSTLLISVYGLIKAGDRFARHIGQGKYWPRITDMFADNAFPYHLRTLSEQYTGIHPTHSCIFLGISALFVFNFLISRWSSSNNRKRFLYITLLTLIMFIQAMLASRTPFIATMAAGTLLLILHSRRKIYAFYALGFICILSAALWFLVPSFSARFGEVTLSNANLPTDTSENSFNIRTGIYLCSMRIVGEHWIWGVGPGQVQTSLNSCYDEIAPKVYTGKNYNTHNQFLDYWAGLGIAGPLALLVILVYLAVRNYRLGEFLPPAIAIFFTIAFMTENLLIRQNGIVCFAFFTSWFFFSQNGEKPTHLTGN